jgi:hypothetical protein
MFSICEKEEDEEKLLTQQQDFLQEMEKLKETQEKQAKLLQEVKFEKSQLLKEVKFKNLFKTN